jgi:abortive infection bacteriophage resistance protein
MTTPFTKPATSYEEQVELLQQRGMAIDNPREAAFYLQHLNYYRLAAYWLPFEADHARHTFRPGTRFTDVLAHYTFDRELRLLMLDAIERIEVSVRSTWAYELAHRHGPHAHLDARLAGNPERWRELLDKTRKEVDRSDETFIRHLKRTYAEALPPIWAVCEVISLGTLSQWFNNFAPRATRGAVARVYGVDERVLASWLRHLALVRNTCAHHSRLWNRAFTILPMVPRHEPAHLVSGWNAGSRRLYNTLVITLHLMDVIAPQHHWRARLKDLLGRPGIALAAMGFPAEWAQRAIWLEGRP